MKFNDTTINDALKNIEKLFGKSITDNLQDWEEAGLMMDVAHVKDYIEKLKAGRERQRRPVDKGQYTREINRLETFLHHYT